MLYENLSPLKPTCLQGGQKTVFASTRVTPLEISPSSMNLNNVCFFLKSYVLRDMPPKYASNLTPMFESKQRSKHELPGTESRKQDGGRPNI